MDIHLPSIEMLKREGLPQWFGLGFIQVKTSNLTRYHFWHPDLMPDVHDEEIHDHRYRFTSHVLRGEISNEIFHAEPCAHGDYQIEQVTCNEGEEAIIGQRCLVRKLCSTNMRAGDVYTMEPDTLHRSTALQKSVTKLEREMPYAKQFATVIRKHDEERACPFRNTKPQRELWDYVYDCLTDKPGYHLASIPKGTLGSPSKIVEEALELLDAYNQDSKIMAAVELSDLYGAIRRYMAREHPDLTFADLSIMSDITERAFRNGRR